MFMYNLYIGMIMMVTILWWDITIILSLMDKQDGIFLLSGNFIIDKYAMNSYSNNCSDIDLVGAGAIIKMVNVYVYTFMYLC